MQIIVSVIDAVYGRPAAGVEVSVSLEPSGQDPGRSTGPTDALGNFSFSTGGDDLSGVQQCTLRLDVGSYYASLGIVAGCKEISMVARTLNAERETRIATVISPFSYTTWRLR